jgi:hypothetical protein
MIGCDNCANDAAHLLCEECMQDADCNYKRLIKGARAEGYKQGQEDEREACAAIADNFSGQSKWVGGTARAISKFIRARGEKKNK